jgi:hypothetical protein
VIRDWLALFAGPVAWFCAHVASWMLGPPAHEKHSLGAIYTIDAIALVIAIVAAASALLRWRALRGTDRGRDRFLAVSGVALSALSILLIVGIALPDFLLIPGAEP